MEFFASGQASGRAPGQAPERGPILLAELVDASLVTSDLTLEPPRYGLLETVRHVGLAHLGAGDRLDGARDAHARWMTAFAERLVAGQRVRDPGTAPAARRDMANLQAALTWLTRTPSDAASRYAAMVALVTWDNPEPGLTAQLCRLRPADPLLALAAGAGEYVAGHMERADELFTTALDGLPAGSEWRWAGLLLRLANAMFAGRVADVHRDARDLVADPGTPVWAAAQGPCGAALISHYTDDTADARRWMDEYPPLGDDLDGFGAFTRAELLSSEDPEAALGWYAESLRHSSRAGQTYITNVARIGRAAVLVRLGRHDDASAACRAAIVAVRAAGMTAQVWTALRITAELLAARGAAEAAAAIVAAADADPLAPAVMGPDLDRQAGLRRTGVRPPGRGDAAATCVFALDRL